MGKYLTSLLILASSILLPDEIFADNQVRRVQEELRKRHLFYADANGEKSAALTLALKRYQEKKGFAPTGLIDSVTLVSLGLSATAPTVATTPSVVAKRGQVHGANGERLPSSPPLLWPNDESTSKFDLAIVWGDYLGLELADFGFQGVQPRRASGTRVRPTGLENERVARFEPAFDLTSSRLRQVAANPDWNSLVLQPAAEVSGEFEVIDDKRMHQAAVRPQRRSQRRNRRVKARKETNPFVLTYHTVDRAIRSLFGDAQTKKKRSTSKRL